MSVAIRLELKYPACRSSTRAHLKRVRHSHGLIMIFFMVMPR